MLKKSRYERQRDIYGNVVRVLRCIGEGIEETKYEYDLKGRIVNESIYYSQPKEFVVTYYYYEDDEYGNTIKQTVLSQWQEIDALGDKIVVREHKNEWYYKNTYTSAGFLKSTSMYDMNGEFYYTQEFIYKKDVLYMDEISNKSGKRYRTYYKYNERSELTEKEFRLPTGEVSYYYTYKKVGLHGASYTLVNPEKSKYKWKLSDLSHDSITIDIVEDLTTPEVYKEIFEYIIKYYSNVNSVFLGASETDASTYGEELQMILQYYCKKHNIVYNFI